MPLIALNITPVYSLPSAASALLPLQLDAVVDFLQHQPDPFERTLQSGGGHFQNETPRFDYDIRVPGKHPERLAGSHSAGPRPHTGPPYGHPARRFGSGEPPRAGCQASDRVIPVMAKARKMTGLARGVGASSLDS